MINKIKENFKMNADQYRNKKNEFDGFFCRNFLFLEFHHEKTFESE
jgi:hypothetical protein